LVEFDIKCRWGIIGRVETVPISIVLSRKAEAYIERNPLEWVIIPEAARHDRKRSILELNVPWGLEFHVYDGERVIKILVTGIRQDLRFKLVRLNGPVMVEDGSSQNN
jgi:hypothetical protein